MEGPQARGEFVVPLLWHWVTVMQQRGQHSPCSCCFCGVAWVPGMTKLESIEMRLPAAAVLQQQLACWPSCSNSSRKATIIFPLAGNTSQAEAICSA
jgi:hypothetical protein